MSKDKPQSPKSSQQQVQVSQSTGKEETQTIVIQMPAVRRRGFWGRIVFYLLLVSVIFNVWMYLEFADYFSETTPPYERFLSGEPSGKNKIAVLKFTGTIMPPYTERFLQSIERATDDEDVKGIVLTIDSPGGFVADSHQIYHRLKQLSKKKPMLVVMKRMAASGGYYIAMGAGPETTIYAEPTTWVGSIGVIIPRYNITGLAKKLEIKSEPIITGKFKDSLDPMREMRPDEIELWSKIIDESFQTFMDVIVENRPGIERKAKIAADQAGNLTAIEELATGQIFTSSQSRKNRLVDKIGFEDEAIADLINKLKDRGIEDIRVVTYRHPRKMIDFILGNIEAEKSEDRWNRWINAFVPQPMYYFSSIPVMPFPTMPN